MFWGSWVVLGGPGWSWVLLGGLGWSEVVACGLGWCGWPQVVNGGLASLFRDTVASSARFASQDATVLKFDIFPSKHFRMSQRGNLASRLYIGLWPKHNK